MNFYKSGGRVMNYMAMLLIAFFCSFMAGICCGVFTLFERKPKWAVPTVFSLGISYLIIRAMNCIPAPGTPSFDIPPVDVYVASIVYVTGENVNFGIEKKDAGSEGEHIRYYQLPKNIFEGDFPQGPARLVISETNNLAGKIKRLRFEPISKATPEVVSK